MRISLVVPPAEPVITVPEARAHLRVDHREDDAVIAGLIEAAISHLDGPEGILGRALVTQTWRYMVYAWPVGGHVALPSDTVASVAAVRYFNEAGEHVALDPAAYVLRSGFLSPATGYEWPDLFGYGAEVDFVTGYGGAADVPRALKHAILLLVGAWYAQREAVADEQKYEIPMGVKSLVQTYRRQFV